MPNRNPHTPPARPTRPGGRDDPPAGDGYRQQLLLNAPADRTLEALTTLAGLRGWWTTIVTGSPTAGGLLAFGFQGLEETITMRVDAAGGGTVRWRCREHTGAAAWAGTTLTFAVQPDGPERSRLAFTHDGLPAGDAAAGWQRFLASLARLVETGHGQPYHATPPALEVALGYHQAWTGRDFAAARALLAPDLHTDVPLNTYTGADDFAAAVAAFRGQATGVELLTAVGDTSTAVLVYDLHAPAVGTLRVAETHTVTGGRITQLRHVHDTAALSQPPQPSRP